MLNSVVKVTRLSMTAQSGRASWSWQDAPSPLNYVRCRLDLTFQRPGKDQPMAVEAGKAPDRLGVMFCMPFDDIRAGDRVVAVPNDFGETPVKGTFEIRVMPDVAQAYAHGHHIEVQIVEVAQNLTEPKYPPGQQVGLP